MPSTQRTNGDFFPLLVVVLTVIILLLILPTSQEIIYWIILVGICVSISKYDVVDGISLDFP